MELAWLMMWVVKLPSIVYFALAWALANQRLVVAWLGLQSLAVGFGSTEVWLAVLIGLVWLMMWVVKPASVACFALAWADQRQVGARTAHLDLQSLVVGFGSTGAVPSSLRTCCAA
jgi:hypothetical protein